MVLYLYSASKGKKPPSIPSLPKFDNKWVSLLMFRIEVENDTAKSVLPAKKIRTISNAFFIPFIPFLLEVETHVDFTAGAP